jgi:hypothetical protein
VPPTNDPTKQPTPEPTLGAGGPSGTGTPVANVIDVNALSYFVGSINSGTTPGEAHVFRAYDQNTNKVTINHDNVTPPGFVVTPSWPSSIIKGIRIYTSNNYKDRDPLSYSIYGRNGSNDSWTLISESAFSITRYRNPLDVPIVSTFEAKDPSLNGKEIYFENDVAYWEYKVLFPTNKGDSGRTAMAEVELPGILV